MATININENITLTATEETISTYIECVNRIDVLRGYQDLAFDACDWEDYEDYGIEMDEYYDRLLNM